MENAVLTNTVLKYMNNTHHYASLVSVIEVGSDTNGLYLVFDQTIGYPGGGGQPMDNIILSHRNKDFSKVLKCDFNGGYIKYYIDNLPRAIREGDEIAMTIDRGVRTLHSAYHTAGHWIASLVTENLLLPVTPTKGFHFPKGAYVEFSGNASDLPEDLIYQIEYAMLFDRQTQINVKSSIISTDEFYANNDKISMAENFRPMDDRPLRLVTFDTYKSVPCGGTHLSSLRELKAVKPTKVKVKGGKIRISYSVDVPLLILPS